MMGWRVITAVILDKGHNLGATMRQKGVCETTVMYVKKVIIKIATEISHHNHMFPMYFIY